MIKGIFFDVGGTLCGSLKDLNAKPSFKKILADYTGLTIADFDVQKQTYLWTEYRSRRELIKRLCHDICFDDWQGLYNEISRCSYQIKLYNDVIPLLKRLNKRYKLGLLCNTTVWTAYNHEQLGLADYIEGTIMSCYVGAVKPDVKIFKHAEKVFGYDPCELLHVGDTVKYDIEPALKAGWKAILLCRDRSITKAPVPIISDLHQLEDKIQLL